MNHALHRASDRLCSPLGATACVLLVMLGYGGLVGLSLPGAELLGRAMGPLSVASPSAGVDAITRALIAPLGFLSMPTRYWVAASAVAGRTPMPQTTTSA